MNLIEIVGNLGSDPEERFTNNGKKVISFRVAAKARQGKEEVTIWWRVTIWGDRYDKMLPYLKKGSSVIIIGEMNKPETYVDKAGVTQVSLSMNAEIIKFNSSGKPKSESSENPGNYRAPQTMNPSFSPEPAMNEEMAFFGADKESGFANDDLPF